MKSRTLDRTDRAVDVGEATTAAGKPTSARTTKSTAGKRPSPLREAWERRSLIAGGDRLRGVARAVFFRSVTIVTDFLLVFITAMVVIPTLGAWLHQQSGAAQGSLTMAGTIVMWLTPLCFLVIILAAGEIAVMRGLWRWGTRRIQKIRDPRAGEADTATTSGPSRGPAAQAGRHGGKNTRTRRT